MNTTVTFKTIAAAISFSPYCMGVLMQAIYIADKLNARLLLFHIGEKTPEKEAQLNEMMKSLNAGYNPSDITWKDGNEVHTIIELCDLNQVDLLVLGAKVKENILKFYIGSIARKISRKANCSVLLVTNDTQKQTHEFNKIVISGIENPKTPKTISTALLLAEKLKSKQVYVVNELDSNVSMMTEGNIASEKNKSTLKKLSELIDSCNNEYENKGFSIAVKTIKGKAGYAIAKFAKSKKADLLVVNSPDVQLNVMHRIFTHDMEYILANLPCNLLIVHEQKNNG